MVMYRDFDVLVIELISTYKYDRYQYHLSIVIYMFFAPTRMHCGGCHWSSDAAKEEVRVVAIKHLQTEPGDNGARPEGGRASSTERSNLRKLNKS